MSPRRNRPRRASDAPRPELTDERFHQGEHLFYEMQCLKCHVLGDPSVPGAQKSPTALVFGTDLPSTRAERPFSPADMDLIERVLGRELAAKVFWDNPIALYRVHR